METRPAFIPFQQQFISFVIYYMTSFVFKIIFFFFPRDYVPVLYAENFREKKNA